MRDRRWEERLEAARYGALAEVEFDTEELLHRVARTDPRFRDVIRSLKFAREYPDLIGAGHQTFSELVEPVQLADYSAVAPAAATEIVLWTPNTSTQTHSAIPANFFTRPGQNVKLRAGGVMTVPGTAGTCTVTPRWGTTTGGVTLGPSTAIAAGIPTQTNVPWFIQTIGVVRTIGNAGTFVMIGALDSNGIGREANFGGVTATVDYTTAQGITFSVTMSVGSYSWTPKIVQLEIAG